ncbi:hypothetical protein K488DRAFT_6567, partial [Vararia minispora EC-137]
STFGYIAYEEETELVVWLKDTWRRSEPDLDIDTEGEIYRILHKADVRNIPKLVCAGDVFSTANVTESSSPQTTTTQAYVEETWACDSETTGIGHHTHYRHVVLGIGRPLTSFKSPEEVVAAVADAQIAHEDAFGTRILHRDISAGNILISLDGKGGLLIDWELALNLDRTVRTTRQWITGTWQFMSFRLLKQIGKGHQVSDDMESILWVLIFVFLRYYPGSL